MSPHLRNNSNSGFVSGCMAWFEVTEGQKKCYNQSNNPIIIYKAELWFLRMTHRLIVLYNCMKFHLNSFNGCQLTERT